MIIVNHNKKWLIILTKVVKIQTSMIVNGSICAHVRSFR